MTLEQFIASPELKYAVIRYDSYLADETAQSLSSSPRTFDHNGVQMALLSVPSAKVAQLAQYAQHAANGYEFELTLNTGKVTLLHRSAVIGLLPVGAEQ